MASTTPDLRLSLLQFGQYELLMLGDRGMSTGNF